MKLPHPPLLSQESSALRWRRGGSCSLTITLRGAGSERDPLPSKSQNLCPFLATSTRVVWGFASLKTFIFTNSFVIFFWLFWGHLYWTQKTGEEHVKAILLLCHWINRGNDGVAGWALSYCLRWITDQREISTPTKAHRNMISPPSLWLSSSEGPCVLSEDGESENIPGSAGPEELYSYGLMKSHEQRTTITTQLLIRTRSVFCCGWNVRNMHWTGNQ